MTNTGRISGKDVFLTLAGVDLSPDFTKVSVKDEGNTIDLTAADDTFHYYINTLRDGSLDLELFYDGATTTVWAGIAPGTAGTLIVAPKGTATGSPKWTWTRALLKSRNIDMPFDDGITVKATIQFSSLVTEATY
jgi:hypothetical protein